MADPQVWGPLLWKILHNVSENLGKNTNKILQKDEIQYFQNMLKQIKNILPCKLCVKHYSQYYFKNKKENIQYDELKDYAKKFFYNLHEEINKDNHKQSFNYDDLKIYNCSKDTVSSYVLSLDTIFKQYTQINLIKGDELREFFKTLVALRRFMNYY
jgi:hypothetical protein